VPQGLTDEYVRAAEIVRQTGCTEIGLGIDSTDWEYPWWWLLDTPQSWVRMQALNPLEATEKYADTSFHPCVVICTICAGTISIDNLKLEADYGNIQLFQ